MLFKFRHPYEKLFEQQIDYLSKRGVSRKDLECLTLKQQEVVEYAKLLEIPKDHLPFIPVIRCTTRRDLGNLMALVQRDAYVGRNRSDIV